VIIREGIMKGERRFCGKSRGASGSESLKGDIHVT
jgi:hypothetical protein